MDLKEHQSLRGRSSRGRCVPRAPRRLLDPELSSWSTSSFSSAPGISWRSNPRSGSRTTRDRPHRADAGARDARREGKPPRFRQRLPPQGRDAVRGRGGQREISRLPVSRLGLRRLGQERRRQGPQDGKLSRLLRRRGPQPRAARKGGELQRASCSAASRRRSAARGFPRDMRFFIDVVADQGPAGWSSFPGARCIPTAATGSCSSTTASIPITSRPRISRTWTCRRGAAEARAIWRRASTTGRAQLRRRRDLRARARPRRDLARSARAREAADLPGARGDPRARRRAARRMDAQGAQRARLPQHADRRRDHADAAHFPAARSGPHRDAELLPRPVGEAGEQRAWRLRQFEDFFNPGGWRRRTTQ